MRSALEDNVWYCHAFCKIPKVQLICTINDDETNGDIERELIRTAENVGARTTHRQLTLDAKKRGETLATYLGQKNVETPYPAVSDEKIDLNTSKGQTKCSG